MRCSISPRVRPTRSAIIGGIVIHDPLDDAVLPPHALVLGRGSARTLPSLRSVASALSAGDAVGLIVRAPFPDDTELREAAARARCHPDRAATWRVVVALGDDAAGADRPTGSAWAMPERLGGIPSGDLFAVANAVAALVDAPVTIEDRESRVLAFSGRQEEADPSRIETILGRQVPERYSRAPPNAGVFRELQRSDRPSASSPSRSTTAGFTVPRLAAAVRAGDEFLGSIWVARAPGISVAERERGSA